MLDPAPDPGFARRRVVSSLAGLLVALTACASSDELVGVTVATTGSTAPRVGETVTLVVRAIYGDGSSSDVTELAACRLEGDAAVGALVGRVFTAQQPGPASLVCEYAGVRGSLALTVAGLRVSSVAAIQRGEVTAGTKVEVEAVVFALAPDAGFTDFWMQDPGGGPYSGIYVRDRRMAGAMAPREGDRVKVVGAASERNGRTVLEMTELTVSATATPVVSTVPLGELDAARWDGCLVEIDDVVVTNPAVDDYTWQVAAAAAPTGPRLLVDTLLHDPVRRMGQHFDRITGPVFPFLDDAGMPALSLVPRRADDLAGEAAGLTPYDLRDGVVADGAAVTLAGLVVTAIDYVDPQGGFVDLYVQAPDGGAGAGVFLRDARTMATAPPAIGDRVDVEGTFELVRNRRTVSYTSLTVTGPGDAPPATAIDLTSADLDAYQSVLVEVAEVRVSQEMLDAYTFEIIDDRSGGTATARVDTSLYDPAPRVGDRYRTLTGVVFRGSMYAAIAPRDGGDVEDR